MKRKLSPIIPPAISQSRDRSIDRLLHPARFYARPSDVAADASLELSEKRAILSSWVSDACAVESMPALRRPPGLPEPVSFDEIMDALRRLDAIGTGSKTSDAAPNAAAGAQRLDA